MKKNHSRSTTLLPYLLVINVATTVFQLLVAFICSKSYKGDFISLVQKNIVTL
jgi:hypothetical protein